MLLPAVINIIADKGRLFTIRRSVGGDYDRTTGKKDSVLTDITTTAKGLFLKYSARERIGTTIQMGDVKLCIDPSTLPSPPQVGDLVISNETLKVRDVQTEMEGSTITLWVCQCER